MKKRERLYRAAGTKFRDWISNIIYFNKYFKAIILMVPWLSFQMLYCSSERSTWSTLNLQERSWKVNWLPNTPQKQCMWLSLNKSVPSVPTHTRATKIQSSTTQRKDMSPKKHDPKTSWIITKHPRVQGGLHGYPTKKPSQHSQPANHPRHSSPCPGGSLDPCINKDKKLGSWCLGWKLYAKNV